MNGCKIVHANKTAIKLNWMTQLTLWFLVAVCRRQVADVKVDVQGAIEDASNDDDGDDVTNDITMLNDGQLSVMFVLLLNFGTLVDDPSHTTNVKKKKSGNSIRITRKYTQNFWIKNEFLHHCECPKGHWWKSVDDRQLKPIDDESISTEAFLCQLSRQSLDAADDVAVVVDSKSVKFSLATNGVTMFPVKQRPYSIASVMHLVRLEVAEFPLRHWNWTNLHEMNKSAGKKIDLEANKLENGF